MPETKQQALDRAEKENFPASSVICLKEDTDCYIAPHGITAHSAKLAYAHAREETKDKMSEHESQVYASKIAWTVQHEHDNKRSAIIKNDKNRDIDICNVRNVNYTSEVLEEAERGKKLLVRTYPILFNIPTKIQDVYGEYEEIVKPEAFREVDFKGVKILGGHDPNIVLGVVGIGGTRMEVDETGVFAEVDLAYPNTQSARDWYNMVEKGLVDGASYGFRTKSPIVNGLREIRDIELFEVSLVAFPAYYEASVIAARKCKKDDEECEEKKKKKRREAEIADLEKMLKELKGV